MAKENEINQPQASVTPPAASETPNRDKWTAGLRGKYGDELSEDELYGKAMEAYDSDHEYRKKSSAEAESLNNLLKSDENLNDFFCDLFEFGKEGKPWKAMAHIKPLMQQYINGEITDEEYEAEAKRLAEADANAARVKEMAKKAFADECQERGWDVEETMERLNSLINHDCETEEECREQVKNMFRILDYEPAVAAAEVRGKNENIAEQRRNVPKTVPKGGAGVAAPAKPKQRNFFDYAEAAS